MVYGFEIVGIIFAVLMIYFSYTQFKRKVIGKTALVFWMVFWFAGLLLILFHALVSSILPPLNIIRVLDLYMILSFMFLFATIFYLYIRINKNQRKLEELARILTLKGVKRRER